jgi:hypothetical protein
MPTVRSEIGPYHRPSQPYLALGRLKPWPRRSRSRDAFDRAHAEVLNQKSGGAESRRGC